MSYSAKLVLWHEDLFRLWCHKIPLRDWRAIVLTCKRWRTLAFRPQTFFFFWPEFTHYQKSNVSFFSTKPKVVKKKNYKQKTVGLHLHPEHNWLYFHKGAKCWCGSRTNGNDNVLGQALFFGDAWEQVMPFLPSTYD